MIEFVLQTSIGPFSIFPLRNKAKSQPSEGGRGEGAGPELERRGLAGGTPCVNPRRGQTWLEACSLAPSSVQSARHPPRRAGLSRVKCSLRAALYQRGPLCHARQPGALLRGTTKSPRAIS